MAWTDALDGGTGYTRAMCLLQGGPMHDTILPMPQGAFSVVMSEPMRLIAGDDDAPEMFYLEHLYQRDSITVEGLPLFSYQGTCNC
jgi:hypothetical protein